MIDVLLGGVFITWRQKDPKEPDMGLYGKKYKIYDSNDLFLMDIDEDIKDISTTDTKTTSNFAFLKNISNFLWSGKKSKFTCGLSLTTSSDCLAEH